MARVTNRTRDERIHQIREHISFLQTIKSQNRKNLNLTVMYWKNEIKRLQLFKNKTTRQQAA